MSSTIPNGCEADHVITRLIGKGPNVTPLTQEKILMQPYDHILQCSGKQVRSKLIQAFNYWLHIPDSVNNEIQCIIEMLHNASLLVDDIEDNSVLRRGLPVAHHIYGVASTINSANYVYFKALDRLIQKLPKEQLAEAVSIFTEQMLLLHQGQGMDIYWRDSQTCPTMEEYLDMIEKKTTGLFGLGLGLMQLFSDNKKDYMPLIRLMGRYFQIRDDYANLKFEEYADNKSFCEDLTEGKFSFPIVHAITNHPEDQAILSILRLKTTKDEIKLFAVNHLEKLGSFAYTVKTLQEIRKQTMTEIERLGGNPYLVEIMNYLYIEKKVDQKSS